MLRPMSRKAVGIVPVLAALAGLEPVASAQPGGRRALHTDGNPRRDHPSGAPRLPVARQARRAPALDVRRPGRHPRRMRNGRCARATGAPWGPSPCVRASSSWASAATWGPSAVVHRPPRRGHALPGGWQRRARRGLACAAPPSGGPEKALEGIEAISVAQDARELVAGDTPARPDRPRDHRGRQRSRGVHGRRRRPGRSGGRPGVLPQALRPRARVPIPSPATQAS